MIPWIDDLSFLALEQAPLSAQWKQWLRKSESIPDDQQELARQISTLVAFDFVTANWDRWSGGNVGIDKATGTLLYIDNDGAFFEVPPAEGLQRNKKLLDGVDKFSRSFVTRLKRARRRRARSRARRGDAGRSAPLDEGARGRPRATQAAPPAHRREVRRRRRRRNARVSVTPNSRGRLDGGPSRVRGRADDEALIAQLGSTVPMRKKTSRRVPQRGHVTWTTRSRRAGSLPSPPSVTAMCSSTRSP